MNGLRSLRSGMTNGLTNGSGFTNGLGSRRYSREIRRNRWKLFLIPLVFAVLVSVPLFGADFGKNAGPQIDGRFDEWTGAPGHTFPPRAVDPNVAIDRVAFLNETDSLFLLVQVKGTQVLAGGPDPAQVMNAVYVFVDGDRNAGTGYPIHGIGADRLLEVQGRGGTVLYATAFTASQSIADARDWRSWTDPAPIAAAASGNRLEVAVDWLFLGSGPRSPVFLVISQGWDGSTDVADVHLGIAPGLVQAVQRPAAPTVLSGANAPLLSVNLSAADAAASVSALTIRLLGTAPLSDITSVQLVDATSGTSLAQRVPVGRSITFSFPPVALNPGTTRAWTVTASVSGTDGGTLGAEIPGPYGVGAGPATVTLTTVGSGERLGYVGAIPPGPAVDGAFVEWANETLDGANEPTTGGNPSVDLARFGHVVGPTNLTFHVALRGPAFAGTVLPVSPNRAPSNRTSPPDRDRDGVPDGPDDPYPDDFNNDGTPDALTNCDVDGDNVTDATCAGPDLWLNTTIPVSFPAPYGGRVVSVYIGPSNLPPMIGEDGMRLLVDTDNVSATGFYTQGIGADYMVEIRGREGLVANASLYAHGGANPWDWRWTWIADVPFALGLMQLEARANVAALVPAPALLLQMSDGGGGTDDLGIGTRGLTRSAPVFSGPEPAFVKTTGGTFAYRSTGTQLEAYARASRGAEEEIVVRLGSLFLGWRTLGIGGIGDSLEGPSAAAVNAAGRMLAVGGFSGAWEQYEIGGDVVKHSVWIASAPTTSSAYVALQGELRIPDNATVVVDGQPRTGLFATDAPILVEYDGYRIRLEAPFAFESRNPGVRVSGRYEGEVRGPTVRLAMAVPSAWLREPSRAFPVVLDPTATGIIDTSTASSPVGGPHQRNVLHDGTNFWAFFHDGTTVQYEPSADGLSWVNTKSTAFTTSGLLKVSTWFHDGGATKIVYVVGDTGALVSVKVRRGTISGTTITWGSEVTVTVSGSAHAKHPFITRDASGYIWVAANTREGGSTFNFAAVRSTNTDDVSAWNARTQLMSASIVNDFIQGMVAPLGSGDVYAIWYADGTIYGKRYTASNSTWWTNGDTIDTTTAGVLTKAPSALVDGSNNIHLVYVDSSGAVKYRQRTSSWGSATTLDAASGNTYATISRDTGTGDLYVFYISSSNQIKAQKYSGSWTSVTLETNTKAKSRLTSVNDVSSASNMAWTWAQGSASPYDVKFSVLSTSLDSRTIDTSTDASGVSYNHQRKIFYDGAYFWAFYHDGTNTFATMSADTMTWENSVWQMFTTSSIDNPSVWFHDTGSSKIVYLVGDDTTVNNNDLTARRCTISGTTPTCGSDTTVAFTGQANMAGMIAFITKDTSGYLWIISNDAPTSSTFNVGVVRSQSTDSVASWGSVTNLMSASISTNNIFPMIVPLSGGDMYAIWYANGNIQGKKYTASNTTWWNSVEAIATTTAGVTTKIPSATVDSSNNIEIAYIDSSGAVIRKQRTSSWGSADTVDSGSGNTSPTITRESSTGDLYVFYLQSTGQVKGRKLSGGSWSNVTTGIDTSTTAKTFITSPYSVDAAWKIALEWDQGASSPYEIKVARIPEFGDALPPMAATVLVVLALRSRRRRVRNAREAAH